MGEDFKNMEIRLQKIIADAGIASRRKAEELIVQGLVQVNGKIVRELGFKADPNKEKIKVNGKIIKPNLKKIYLALNKPVGIISSRKDEKGRQTVIDIIPLDDYLYPVGRLDFESSGLIILTNDGEAANSLLHPKFEIPKTYKVDIEGELKNSDLEKFKAGIKLEEGLTAPAKAKILSKGRTYTKLEVIIHEGKNRQIRRMFEELGYQVTRLKRISIGNIELGKLPIGRHRYLSPEEINWLKTL